MSELVSSAQLAEMALPTTEVGRQIDEALAKQRSALRGAAVTGWVALCGFGFIEALKYHKSVKPLYERWREGAAYREADGINPIEFVHNGIRFIHYTGNFGKAKLDDDKAILLPTGPGRLYEEYFAPANYTETVNTVALPYWPNCFPPPPPAARPPRSTARCMWPTAAAGRKTARPAGAR